MTRRQRQPRRNRDSQTQKMRSRFPSLGRLSFSFTTARCGRRERFSAASSARPAMMLRSGGREFVRRLYLQHHCARTWGLLPYAAQEPTCDAEHPARSWPTCAVEAARNRDGRSIYLGGMLGAKGHSTERFGAEESSDEQRHPQAARFGTSRYSRRKPRFPIGSAV